jgi:hypothetical protein
LCRALPYATIQPQLIGNNNIVALSVYSRTLQKAAELIGGRKQLCRYLKVPTAELQKWIADQARPPVGVFLRAVDLIIVETPPPASSSDDSENSPPRDCSAAEGSAATRY